MGTLMKFEMHKLKKQKSFYICTLIMVALLFLSAMTTNALMNGSPEFAAQFSGSGIDSMIGALGNCSFLLIAGIFTALTVCEDYEQQTVKNIFSRGYSRGSAYTAKLMTVWIATSVMFLIAELAALISGSLYFGIGEVESLRFLAILGVQYVVAMANVALFFAFSSTFRKNGSSIAATIVAPMLVNVMLSLADSLLKLKDVSLTSYWLSSFLGDLTLSVGLERMTVCLVASLIYIPVFVFVGMKVNRDIELQKTFIATATRFLRSSGCVYGLQFDFPDEDHYS